ncbi:DUF3313 family protein [Undibacterium sp. Ren11W]|uniref:DUF3313 family protein n=1 Tax=Undibacterium sp. Ren11W TaxID=3413045 RepID=UPI003BEF6E1E
MNKRFLPCKIVFLSLMLVTASSFAASNKALDEVMSHDGLQQTKLKGVDLAYAKPGASLAAYTQIKLDPVEVSFSSNWDPTRTGSRFKLDAEERENIRSGVAKVVYERFAKTLQAKDGYKIVNDAAADVLRVKASIINLYVNAPDTMTAGRSRTYTVSAGEMTLVLELYDSETGAVLARIVDRQEARNSSGRLSISNSVINSGEAESIADGWASILRKSLDKAHGIGKK